MKTFYKNAARRDFDKIPSYRRNIRLLLWSLWLQLDLNQIESWKSHPDWTARDPSYAFHKVNFLRWIDKHGPLLEWPEAGWWPTPYFGETHIEANGTRISGWLDFFYPENVGTLAIAFHTKRGWTVFGSKLLYLEVLRGRSRFEFSFSSTRPGWKNGRCTLFDRGGNESQTTYLPRIYTE